MTTPSLEELRSCWAARGREALVPLATRAARIVLGLLADGRPVSAEQIATGTDRSVEEVRGWLEQARDHGYEVDDRGRLVGAALTLQPTAYEFRVRGNDLHAWCGFDTLFLPMVLGESARVRSTCAITDRPVRFDIDADGTITDAVPDTIQVAIVGPAVTNCGTTGPASPVCRQMPFLANPRAGLAWQTAHPGVAVVSLADAIEVARTHAGIPDPTLDTRPGSETTRVAPEHPLAATATATIHSGDLPALRRLLDDHPQLATMRIGDQAQSRTLLHVATDWPGHHPEAATTVSLLLDAGADVDARFAGPHAETALHWAASSDDVAVLDRLLDAGADIEATGGVIGNGTPLADAVAFGQWEAARRLIERGAEANLWQAAALGLTDRMTRRLGGPESPTGHEITVAFWCACHGGSRATAAVLLDHGADVNWVGFDNLTPLEAAQRSGATDMVAWLRDTVPGIR